MVPWLGEVTCEDRFLSQPLLVHQAARRFTVCQLGGRLPVCRKASFCVVDRKMQGDLDLDHNGNPWDVAVSGTGGSLCDPPSPTEVLIDDPDCCSVRLGLWWAQRGMRSSLVTRACVHQHFCQRSLCETSDVSIWIVEGESSNTASVHMFAQLHL